MKIIFVMGIAGSGKSTYIKDNFKDFTVVDLFDFQKHCYTFEDCWKSYMDAKDALINAIKENKDVVLEHTLLRAERRKIYIDAVREITDNPIEIILINPEFDILVKRNKERNIYVSDDYLKQNLDVLEIPTESEGFDKVTIIN